MSLEPSRSKPLGVVALAAILTPLGAALAWNALSRFARHAYTSDGFHYYSALRNTLDGTAFFEGPTFEHLFANHTYLTLPALLPFVAVFESPAVLLLCGTLCVLGFAAVAMRMARHLGLEPAAAALLGVLVVLTPNMLEAATGFERYLFQPDVAVPLFIALLWLDHRKGRSGRVALWAALLVLTKEEICAWLPVAWIAVRAWEGPPWRATRSDRLVGAVWIASTAVVLGTQAYFRSVSTWVHVRDLYALGDLGAGGFLSRLAAHHFAHDVQSLSLVLLAPLIIVLGLALMRVSGRGSPPRRAWLAWGVGITVAVGLRLGINVAIQVQKPPSYWGYLPMLAVAWLATLELLAAWRPAGARARSGLVGASLLLLLAYLSLLPGSPLGRLLPDRGADRVLAASELTRLVDELPPPRAPGDAVMVGERATLPVVRRHSHIAVTYYRALPDEVRRHMRSRVVGAVLRPDQLDGRTESELRAAGLCERPRGEVYRAFGPCPAPSERR